MKTPFALIVLAHLKSMETRQNAENRHAWKLRLARGLFSRGLTAEEMRRLFRFIDWMMDLPKNLELIFRQQVQQLEENEKMPFMTTPERFARIESLLPGIELGLDLKFGEEGLKLMPEIRELYDHEKLYEILQAIKKADSPEELRRLWENENREAK